MKSKFWSLVFLSSTGSPYSKKRIQIPSYIYILMFLFAIAGTVGMFRSIYIISNFAFAKLGVYEESKNNVNLKNKLVFLKKRVETEVIRSEKLIAFEDKTRTKFGMDPISHDVRLAGIGGKPDPEKVLLYSLKDPIVRSADTLRDNVYNLLRQSGLQESTFSRTVAHVVQQHDRWIQWPSIWPLGRIAGRITSFFGYRSDPFTGGTMFHEGLDIANSPGTPIFATADGVISFIGHSTDNYGNVIEVFHPNSSYKTIYGHLQNKIIVSQGMHIKRGQLIGYLGSSGRSTGPHLHYEIRSVGRPINPMDFVLPSDEIID